MVEYREIYTDKGPRHWNGPLSISSRMQRGESMPIWKPRGQTQMSIDDAQPEPEQAAHLRDIMAEPAPRLARPVCPHCGKVI